MNPTLAQQFNLNVSLATISLTDTTPWVADGISLSQVKILFQLSSPVGIFYSNTNYGSPDIAPATSPRTFTTPLPLDSTGKVVTGDYSLQMSAQVTNQAFSYSLLAVTTGTSIFTVTGNILSQLLNATGGTITIVGGANAGTYTIDAANCSYDPINDVTNVAVTTSIPSSSSAGSSLTFTATQTYIITNKTSMCFVMPEVEIDIEGDCSTAILTANDTTDYDAYICSSNQPITPTVINRTMTLVFPNNPTTGVPVESNLVTSGTTIQVVSPNLYTGSYQVSVVTQLEYIMPDGSVMIVTVSGQETYTLECDDNLCCAYQCMQNIFTNYLEAKSNNPVEANTKWLPLLIKMMGLWMLTTQAHSCGNLDAYKKNLAALIMLVKSNNCNCCPETTSVPTKVIPLVSTGGGSTASTIVVAGYGIIVTPVTVGTTTTYTVSINTSILNAAITTIIGNQKILQHIDTVQAALVNGQTIIYNASTGLWTNALLTLSNISNVDMSTTPTVGYVMTWDSAGTAIFMPAPFHNVLINDWTPSVTPASLVPTLLKSFTIPANTLKNTGDFVTIDAGFINGKSTVTGNNLIYMYFGATPIQVPLSPFTLTSSTRTSFEFKVSMINSTTLALEYRLISGMLPCVVEGNYWVTLTESASNPLIIQFWGKNTIAVANTLVQSYLRSTINSI
jgi:hypothetical protein